MASSAELCLPTGSSESSPSSTRVAILEAGTARLCEVCTAVTIMSGAGIMLMSGDVVRGSVCSSNEVSALIEELQYTLGEGPCVDAYEQRPPVLEPDLAASAATRWLAFTPPAVEAGVRAVFGFPIQVGAVRLGALNLYRDRPGDLSDDQHADALVMADVAARAVLALQAHAPRGALAAELEAGGELPVRRPPGLRDGVRPARRQRGRRPHPPTRLRVRQRPRLADVARDVVGRRLRFDDRADERAAH